MPSAVPSTPCPFGAATHPARQVNHVCLKLSFPKSVIHCCGPQSSAFWLGAVLINEWRTLFSRSLKSKEALCQMKKFQLRYVTRCMRTWCKDYAFFGCWLCLKIVLLADFLRLFLQGAADVKFTWLNSTAACVFWQCNYKAAVPACAACLSG